jgi:CMP-N,N'-diacetyllegionaminic acid synthase
MNVAFIPARKGSKGIPGKNKKNFCGKPLVQWSIDQAKESKLFDKIIVSTDDKDILKIAEDSGVTPAKRLPGLCKDNTSLDDVLYDYFMKDDKGDEPDNICLLQPTSPLRSVEDIIKPYKYIMKHPTCFSSVSVTWNPLMGWVKDATKRGNACLYLIHKRPNRQTRDNFFLENGAVYWMRQGILLRMGNRVGNPNETYLYEMPPERSLEVDTPVDWFVAEKTYEYLQGVK